MNIRKEGVPFIAGALALFGLLALTGSRFLRLIGIVPALFVTWFFRDPHRRAPEGEHLFISPADGTVLEVTETSEDKVGACTKISIFMSVFSVHVNRSPVSGRVVEKRYRPGKFAMANLGKKTEENERMILYLENEDGLFRVDQVAGLVARRISCWPEQGEIVERGQKIGLIRFGSLLECYLPSGYHVLVRQGEKVAAGETILARRA
ncbi:MAG: phosphatidylserine decarboxylase family protein [Desulfomonilia bacterium]|nr:phosphatidylserine decarboxylase family protein [Desulfomonilia bacterium]